MKKAVSFLKKTLKVILYVVLSFVLLFIVIAILIQIPAIQTKIVHYATSFVSDKTHTKVELKKISIAFPKSLVIEGLYLEDTKKDTLLYAGKLKVNLAFKDLFNKKIHVRSFALEEVTVNLKRAGTDSLFNFNFLVTAFSDSTKPKQVEPKAKSKWTFSADYVHMKVVRFHFDDDYGGTDVAAHVKQLKLKMDAIDIENLDFKIDELALENSSASVRIKKSVKPKVHSENPNKVSVKVTANKILINNTIFYFGDSVNNQSLDANINTLTVTKPDFDLLGESVKVDHLSLSESKAQYNRTDNSAYDTAIVVKSVISTTHRKSDWKVSANSIDMKDNSLAYIVVNKPKLKNTFDVNNLVYEHVTLAATALYYSFAELKASISKLTAVDKNDFLISHFETEFRMDRQSITAKNLRAVTKNSAIDADLSIKFSSLNSLKDSLQFMVVHAGLNNVVVKNSDVIYFVPQLIKQAFFKNAKNTTSITGVINGALNNLYGKDLLIKTGLNTILKTDFNIKGFPNFKTATFDFPNLNLSSGKTDIMMIADTSIPETIELPENISMQVVFKGQLKSFISTLEMNSSYGSAQIFATIDKNENFKSNVSISNFDLGRLVKNTELFGPVSLTAETFGHGLELKTITANIKAGVSQIYLNKYNYHNLTVDGTIHGREFEGKINLNDENAIFDFNGLVNLTPGEEQYKFNFVLQGADLHKLNLTKDEIRIGLTSKADLRGGTVNAINGTAGISNITVVHDGKQYVLDSFLLASVNEPGKSELKVKSALIGIKYNGTMSPASLPKELGIFINSYFPFSDTSQIKKNGKLQNFNFEIQLHNHPILSEVLFPQLKQFEPGLITGSFDSQKNELKINADMQKIVYGSTAINNLNVEVSSNETELNYSISSSSVSNSQIKLDNILLDGKLADNTIFASISSIDSAQNKKLRAGSQIVKNGYNYKLMLDPDDFYLMNDRWDIATDNFIEFGKQGLLIHHLFISKTGSQINMASVHDQFNDDLNIEIKNFKLDDISGIIEKDTGLVSGVVDGNVLFKRVNNAYGIIADAKISNLVVREVPVGYLSVKAENPEKEKFNIDIELSGADNNLTAKGFFIPNGRENSIRIKVVIESLSLKTAEAFSFGSITEASGNLTGNFVVEGKASSPDITGAITFNNAFIKPAVLNNMLQLKHETVLLQKDGVHFNSFTILDAGQHTAIIDGTVKMTHFKDFVFALHVNTQDFLLFNTTAHDNKVFYGKMIIDSRIDIGGPLSLPEVNAKIKMKKGSNFTFAIPEKSLTADKGEGVVEFVDSVKQNQILSRGLKKEKQKSGITGFNISSIIEIDKQATVRLLLYPTTTDSLVVKGEAALSFAIDRSGKMSLTGAYNLNEGSYLVSLESLLKRKFDIVPGSTIIWNGELLEAELSVDATYLVRASPIELVADQMAEMSETIKNEYKQRYPFLIVLRLRGELLHPQISFEIQLPPEEKGIMGGAVNAKLTMLNGDPSSLNKQVFALLVLGRFIQENPLQTETNQVSSIVRTTVGRFLSAQLNQLSSSLLKGVELNFDIQSYDDYQTGQAQGRTQIEIGIKKQLFKERLSVQVGGAVDVEGSAAKQNTAADIISDITVEYKLTKDGRYRLKGFRHNQYEGAIEGQLVETGAGVVYVRDFNKWKEIFRSPDKIKSDSSKIKL